MTKARLALLTLATGAALFVGFCAVGISSTIHGTMLPPNFTQASEVQRTLALDRELSELTPKGFLPIERRVSSWELGGDGGNATFRAAVQVPANTCVSVLVGTSGWLLPVSLGLKLTGRTLVSEEPPGLVGHVQWCSFEPQELQLEATLGSVDQRTRGAYANGQVELVVLQAELGKVGGFAGLRRGVRVPTEEDAVLRTSRAQTWAYGRGEALVPPGFVRVGEFLVFQGRAALFPPTEGALEVVTKGAVRDAGVPVHPRVDLLSGNFPALWTGVTPQPDAYFLQTSAQLGGTTPAEHDPIVDLGRNDFYRVLVGVDPTVLGATRCPTLMFVRGVPFYSPQLKRFQPRTWGSTNFTAVENTVTITDCTQGAYAVLTSDRDQADYKVIVLQGAASGAADAGVSGIQTDAGLGLPRRR